MVYAFVELTITNPDSLAQYAEKAGAALEKHGGAPVSVSKDPMVIEGDGPAPSRAVVLTFPDKESALNWINDEALTETHALRRASGQSRIVLVA